MPEELDVRPASRLGLTRPVVKLGQKDERFRIVLPSSLIPTIPRLQHGTSARAGPKSHTSLVPADRSVRTKLSLERQNLEKEGDERKEKKAIRKEAIGRPRRKGYRDDRDKTGGVTENEPRDRDRMR